MKESRFKTFFVPQLQLIVPGGAESPPGNPRLSPALLAQTGDEVPLRIVVRNVSFAAEAFLAHDAATLQTNEPGDMTFLLQAGTDVTIMLAPGQKLYAISLSANCKICLAISEALPLDIKS